MRVAALVKQIPAFEEMELGSDGRLKREGLELELNPYCRRAVSQAVELAATLDGEHRVTFVTLGPPSAEDVLREALAWAIARDVTADGVLVTDAVFAGSDTLATARALAATLHHVGPFDLVLVGRNSVDSDTGQVGPELAELLDVPFLTGVRHLNIDPTTGVVHARCEHDDGWVQAETTLPSVLSTAERLIEPCKVDRAGRDLVPAALLRCVRAEELGQGPWGQAGSPTTVGAVRLHKVTRDRALPSGTLVDRIRTAVDLLDAREALEHESGLGMVSDIVPAARDLRGPAIAVIAEPDRPTGSRELLGAAALLASEIDGHVVAVTFAAEEPGRLGGWGADAVVHFDGALVQDDAARALGDWVVDQQPWAVLGPRTTWGREVASRAAARAGAGLTGDAVGLEIDPERSRLVTWKPAFGGQLVAAVAASSPVQMVTVRVGVLPSRLPRNESLPAVTTLRATARDRVRVLARGRDDELDTLATAHTVVGVGHGVDPAEYDHLASLLELLHAELGATRKVTDGGWLPRARQIGITGRNIAPRLYVSIGASGRFNHMVGVRAAGTVLAINLDPNALVFGMADIGIVADWHEAVPVLVAALAERASTSEEG
ncbi:MAG: FAD-binding protein [Acidimicrobiales bacterium]